MPYEILLPHGLSQPSEAELVHDNPVSAKDSYQYLGVMFSNCCLILLRDGKQITEAELESDIQSWEIRSVMADESRLPSTFRHAWPTHSADVATGPNGETVRVWRPENPEDRFE